MGFIFEPDRIYLENETGTVLAEVTFPAVSDNVVNINHTYVDDSLRGQGIAGKLLEAAAEKIREENKRAYPTCSYALKWFEKNQDYRDIYTDRI